MTFDAVYAHLVGDYLLQSDRMALDKTRSSTWAAIHALTYALPFLVLTRAPTALAIIVATHFVIDRWRLARFMCWAKNFLSTRTSEEATGTGTEYTFRDGRCYAPVSIGDVVQSAEKHYRVIAPLAEDGSLRTIPIVRWWHPWDECRMTGYHMSRPPWMAVWLLIITDNTMHIGCNALALAFFGG